MKFKTGLQVGAIFPILLALIITLKFWYWYDAKRTFAADGVFLEELIAASQKIEQAIVAATASPEGVQRLLDTVAEANNLLASKTFPDIARQRLLDEVRRQVWQVREVASENPAALSQLAPQFTPSMVRALSRISQTGFTRFTTEQDDAQMLMMVLIAILAMLMTIIALGLSRSMAERITTLRLGNQAIAAGQFDHEIKVTVKDELGQLTEAFNDMARDLKKSYSALHEEIRDHRKTTDILQKSNMQLSEALTRLKRAQTQIIQHERLQALRQMAAGITHDINNTLMPILGISEVLLHYSNRPLTPEELHTALQTINDAASRASTTVRRLAEYFLPEQNTVLQPVAINTLVQSVIEQTKPYWKVQAEVRGAAITIDARPGTVPGVLANEVDLREALVQLIFNAVDAMPNGGTISIATSTEQGQAVIKITDTGTGMDDEVRRKCFEPFFSTKGPEASGMGLTVALGIIRRHGGDLAVDSKPGNGSSFTIKLPIKPSASTPAAAMPSPTPAPALLKRPLKILAVDDQQWTLDLLKMYIEKDGHQVVTAGDGREGLACYSRETFDLVITDMAMPVMNGTELAAKIKAQANPAPVIMLTGFGDLMKTGNEKPPGVDMLVSKPATLTDIRDAIARVMDRRA